VCQVLGVIGMVHVLGLVIKYTKQTNVHDKKTCISYGKCLNVETAETETCWICTKLSCVWSENGIVFMQPNCLAVCFKYAVYSYK
jgi:hypothetical protein